ncbi:MAG: alpha-glucosidase [Chloroflexi bacterium]|nr:alpha-glucosidase [Chloroflexota bacterium]
MTQLKWWQKAVFYQIYPRSFADGNGDGIGDFPGMIERLDYLQDLGIDAIWLSPHYPSPQYDCGYDVSDYLGIAPEYGTMADFRRFLDGAHQRGIRVILDMVLNHTSHEHPWFIESRSSRDNPKRDWYIWRDSRNGEPPNNWYSAFGGPAWEYDASTGQYYYHYFLKQQPDLNWRNPAVKEAMWKVVRFWLEQGVDGFRLDAIGAIFEDPAMPDHTAKMSQVELYRALRYAKSEEEWSMLLKEQEALYEHQVDQPETHELMRELRTLVEEYPDCVLVGEDDDISYYGDGRNELHLLFNFPLMRTNRLTPAWVRANQEARLSALPPGAWPCNTLGNHDTDRVYSHFSDGRNDAALARLSAALMLTLRGTPFLYYGEEIGMTDFLLRDVRQFRDMLGIITYQVETEILGTPPDEAVVYAARMGRDKCRTPMQWSNAPNAGFSPPGVQTWLPVNPNYAQGVNVADELAHPDSLLNFYRRLLRVRRQTPALISGDYVPLHEEAQDYLAFLRRSPGDHQICLVVLNMSAQSHALTFDLPMSTAHVLFSSRSRENAADDLTHLFIAPFEVYIAEIT